MFLLGYDIGSSSVKTALVDAQTKKMIALTHYPKMEMGITSHQQGWAEQDPELWWQAVCISTKEILEKTKIDPKDIKGIGISYQMHGLVLVDKDQKVLRPSIIWCDSRAVDIGKTAFRQIGDERCLSNLMNSPGNFTASKLSWVKENEPHIYANLYKAMLPGDYIAMRLTGDICTTVSGLSEGVFWDFNKNQISTDILHHFGFRADIIPDIKPTISDQGRVNASAANSTGLSQGTPIGYRAGDQPNNALSLGVLDPGQIAATGGTSGVVYGVIDSFTYDPLSRVNNFAHVNHTYHDPRIGVLLCINGSGIAYSFIRQLTGAQEIDYDELERSACQIPVGSEDLIIIPFGNGAERVLENKDIGAHYINIEFNRHRQAHFYRASLEGIAFSFVYGINIMREMGLEVRSIRAGNDNLFQSSIFSQTISNLASCQVDIVETTGAIGAAKASGVACGIYESIHDACQSEVPTKTYLPESDIQEYFIAYNKWLNELNRLI